MVNIKGTQIANQIHKELQQQVAELHAQGVRPRLVVMQVADRPDSNSYIKMKRTAAEKVGIEFELKKFPEAVTEEELLSAVNDINNDALTHGLIVQLPLPAHINEPRVTRAVSALKDVDGFHVENVGALVLRGQTPRFISCTPWACIQLLKRSNVQISGKHAVVLGRSNIVGLPVSHLLLQEDATVTICHSRTQNLPELIKQADILVAAIGRPQFVKGEWIKEGAVVIDVGINSIPDPSKASGYRLVGDVDYVSAFPHASLITPVPGGVGPMTVAMLLKNTINSALRSVPAKE